MRYSYVFLSSLIVLGGCQSSKTKSTAEIGLPTSAKEELDKTKTATVSGEVTGVGISATSPQVGTTDGAKTEIASKPDEIKKTSIKSGGNGITISEYRKPKVGTIFTYKNNWRSLEPRTVYKVVSTKSKFRDKSAIALKAIDGTGNGSTTFHDPANFGLLGYKDKKGNSLITYTKVEQRLKFPMRPGDRWISSWESYEHATKKTTKGGGVVKVVGPEKLVVGAGRFKAMKIQLPLPATALKGMKHYVWYSPSLGVIIREQIANNTFSWSKELEKIKKPG